MHHRGAGIKSETGCWRLVELSRAGLEPRPCRDVHGQACGVRDTRAGRRVELRLDGLTVCDWVDPVFGWLDPSLEPGVLGQQVEQVAAAQKFQRLALGELER